MSIFVLSPGRMHSLWTPEERGISFRGVAGEVAICEAGMGLLFLLLVWVQV